jgi:hypothetical protein
MKTLLSAVYSAISVFALLFVCFEGALSYAQVEYNASGLRDPFENQLPLPAPKFEPVAQEVPVELPDIPKPPVMPPPEITVDGIVSGGPVPQAVVKGRVVRVGDTIDGGARITKITKEGVEVVYEGETFLVSSPSRVVKPGQGGQNVLQ